MLQDEVDIRRDEAVAWHIRLRDGSTADWEEFTEWLERSPENSAAYDAVVIADRRMGDALALAPAKPANINDNDPGEPVLPLRRMRRRPAIAMAAAASVIVAGIFAYQMMAPDHSLYAVETAAGLQRSIRLPDGTRVDLNGGTRILLDHDQARFVSLERGEATFTVTHNPSDPFVVKSGDARIQDVGTVFNMVRDGERLELAVAEGSVVYNPDAEAVQLTAGSTLRTSPDADMILVGSIRPKAVASWRQGRLVYEKTTLGAVAGDISRALGTRVDVTPDIAAQPFTGVIIIDRNQPEFFRRLEGLLDVRAHRSDNGWQLTSRTRAHS